jgi:hypothetical protein
MTSREVLDQDLDALADYLLDRHEIEFSDAVQDWYRNGYLCEEVPEPTDSDPTRRALKASIIERLVEVLNASPRNGSHRPPSWCGGVPPAPGLTRLQSDFLLDGEEPNETFLRRNFLVVKNFMYFV